ncbi:hypothetical protein M8J76_010281 [Diaphorina citri]|nr:hypothetical protein M8J75_012232 [Diaphorina citri]KAI5745345.1 hypothetical protein M8J76_010281 [Diaphorina citri]KAI5751944.1 hypothetical protein M8J77_012350 [Diaphorina citri]
MNDTNTIQSDDTEVSIKSVPANQLEPNVPNCAQLENEIFDFLETNRFTGTLRQIINEITNPDTNMETNTDPLLQISKMLAPHLEYISMDEYHFKVEILKSKRRRLVDLTDKINKAIDQLKTVDHTFNENMFEKYLGRRHTHEDEIIDLERSEQSENEMSIDAQSAKEEWREIDIEKPNEIHVEEPGRSDENSVDKNEEDQDVNPLFNNIN